MTNVHLFYFGPIGEAGHYLWDHRGKMLWPSQIGPWTLGELDGSVQPKRVDQAEGLALLHHKDGWTALAFWDRTIDQRMGSNSVYVADAVLSFEEIVELARSRFEHRWNQMKFEVRLDTTSDSSKGAK